MGASGMGRPPPPASAGQSKAAGSTQFSSFGLISTSGIGANLLSSNGGIGGSGRRGRRDGLSPFRGPSGRRRAARRARRRDRLLGGVDRGGRIAFGPRDSGEQVEGVGLLQRIGAELRRLPDVGEAGLGFRRASRRSSSSARAIKAGNSSSTRFTALARVSAWCSRSSARARSPRPNAAWPCRSAARTKSRSCLLDCC